MIKSAIMTVRIISYVFWLGALASLAFYNFFIPYKELSRSPCFPGQAQIVFRSTTYCGSTLDAHLWNLNLLGGGALLVGAVGFTFAGGYLKSRRELQQEFL